MTSKNNNNSIHDNIIRNGLTDITSISCIIISITIVHCPICGAQLRPRRPRMPTMANAAWAQHGLEATCRSRHHGGEAIVTRPEPMRWGRVRDVGALQAAGASMMERACGALDELSAERQIHVQFMARLGAVGAGFMQQADMQDAAEQDALQDQARDILRREGRRRRQIDRRSRNSEAKSARAGRDQSEPVHRSREDEAEGAPTALPGPPPLIALGYPLPDPPESPPLIPLSWWGPLPPSLSAAGPV